MISFIYFDVGGVVIKDFSKTNKWADLWLELGGKLENINDFETVWKKYEGGLCTGTDTETMVPILNKELGLNIPPHYSLLNGFIKRMAANQSIWPVIYLAQSHFRLGLLSNAYPNMVAQTQAANLLPPVKWDVIIDSSQVKYKKPDRKIFEIAQEKCGCQPKDIFYIDNSAMHVNAAAKLGWQTFLYDSGDYLQSSRQLAKAIKQLTD